MRVFIDCEFWAPGPGRPVSLISLGVVDENGLETYMQNPVAPWGEISTSAWMVENVLANLDSFDMKTCRPIIHAGRDGYPSDPWPWTERGNMASVLRSFVGDATPEFWADCGAFDYVVISQLFGGMDGWPQGWPYYFNDVQAWADRIGLDGLPTQTDRGHNALADAKHVKACWEFLKVAEEATQRVTGDTALYPNNLPPELRPWRP